MNLNISGKVALVCASSAGIGKAIALGLAAEGAKVSLAARGAERLESAKRELLAAGAKEVLATPCDLSLPQDLERLYKTTRESLGPVDILIHNQGGPPPGSFSELNETQLQQAINTNLLAVWRLTALCLPEMKANKWGRILHVLSLSGKEPMPNMILSNILRPAVLGFAKSLAGELAPHGITVNSVLPAAVLSARTESLLQDRANREAKSIKEVTTEAAKSIPIGHIASPEEFAQMAVFLCGQNSNYVTGTAIAVDGGLSRSLY